MTKVSLDEMKSKRYKQEAHLAIKSWVQTDDNFANFNADILEILWLTPLGFEVRRKVRKVGINSLLSDPIYRDEAIAYEVLVDNFEKLFLYYCQTFTPQNIEIELIARDLQPYFQSLKKAAEEV